jgi:hypothetical protein
MTEVFFVLAATLSVFVVFFLVFLVKRRSDGGEAARPRCAQCDCHGSQAQIEGPCTGAGKREGVDNRS